VADVTSGDLAVFRVSCATRVVSFRGLPAGIALNDHENAQSPAVGRADDGAGEGGWGGDSQGTGQSARSMNDATGRDGL
jgi:hypothetical protein